ncbi:MAG: hypothetical protein JSS27_03295 [Planctomycetes bacterium]|nr:hypothetical protein [Planctomycetota bacterium]
MWKRRAWITGIVAISVGYILFCAYEKHSTTPPQTARNIVSFAKVMPPPRKLARVANAGVEYIVWIGKPANSLTLPSGPPCYLFDKTGELSDWSPDIGDDHHLDSYVLSARAAPDVSIEDIIKSLKPTK